MSLEDITLPTNKSETRVSNNRRTIRSGEKGLAIKVTLVDANDQPYDLSTFDLEFNEIKDQGKIVFDSGSGDNSGSFKIVDAKGGVFTYTLAPQVYSASGRAWFVVKQGDTIIDTTKDFYFDVLQDATIHIDNDNYVSSMETELDAFKAMTQREQQNADALIKSLTDQMNQAIADGNTKEADALADAKSKLQALQDATSKLNDSWTAELGKQKQNFTDLQSQWQAQTTQINSDYQTQKKAIQDAADKQLADNKTAGQAAIDKINSDRDDAIKALNDKRDQAIATANTNFQNKLNDIQSDYNDWKTKTIADFTNKVNDLENRVTAAGTKQTELEAAIKSAQDAVANIKNVDWTKYATKDDLANYYDKATMDTKLAQAGKLKTISVNDASPVSPDENGNANLNIDYESKSDFNNKVNTDTPLFDLLSSDNDLTLSLKQKDKQLSVLRFNYDTGQPFNPNHGAGLLFGQLGMSALLAVEPSDSSAQAYIGASTDQEGNLRWLKQIAWKSDLGIHALSNDFTDFNSLRKTGNYHCFLINNWSKVQHAPAGIDKFCIVKVFDNSANGSQLLMATNQNKIFFRTWHGTTNWSSWTELSNADKVASLSDNVATDEGKISDNTKNISTNTQDISTLQGQQTQTAADVASIKKAVGSGAIAQVKQYTEEQEVQALKDSASGNVLGVFFS